MKTINIFKKGTFCLNIKNDLNFLNFKMYLEWYNMRSKASNFIDPWLHTHVVADDYL